MTRCSLTCLLNCRKHRCNVTRATCYITTKVLQTEGDAQCDKLATKLSRQRLRVICRKSPILTYPTCIWHLRWDDPVWVLPRSSASENCSPWPIMRRCLRDPTFNRFIEHRLVIDDRQTDRQTHDDVIYLASMARSAVRRFSRFNVFILQRF